MSQVLGNSSERFFLEQMKSLTQKHFSVSMDKLFSDCAINSSGGVDDDDVRYLLYSSAIDPKATRKTYKRVCDTSGFQEKKRLLSSWPAAPHATSLPPRPPPPL